jgi:acyl phosphate:glycerol-3-phosphate acyltransferase
MKVLYALLSYLLGAVPTGYLVFRLTERKDIRQFGSRNIGATNVMRLKGWKSALPVALADALKGFLPAFLAMRLFGDRRLALVAGLLAVAGHCFPVYIRFRGGKGVATTVGAGAALAPVPLAGALTVFLAAVGLTRFVSLGSILAVVALPGLVLAFGGGWETALWGAAVATVVVLKHGANIGRLLAGTERKLGEKAA